MSEKIVIALVVILLVIIGILQPYFEKEAFNRFRDESEAKATYWNAIWSDLRITSE